MFDEDLTSFQVEESASCCYVRYHAKQISSRNRKNAGALVSVFVIAMEGKSFRNGDKKIYFAAGIYNGEGWLNLGWIPKMFPGHKIFLLHVLQPPRVALFTRYAKDIQKTSVQDNLKPYKSMLGSIKLQAEEVSIKKEKVEEGIVELISKHRIENLVIGAAAKDMVYIESTVTKYVSNKAPAFCQIWFLHKGHLIKTRYEQSVTGGHSLIKTYEDLMREKAEKDRVETASKVQAAENLISEKMQPVKDTKNEYVNTVVAAALRAISTQAPVAPAPAPAPVPRGGNADDELHKQLKEAMAEAETAKREALEDSLKRQNAEKVLSDAAQRAGAIEKMYNEETRIRKEAEELILRYRRKLEQIRSELVASIEDLNNKLKKNSSLADEIAESKMKHGESREKIISSLKMLLSYKNEHKELKLTRDRALEATKSLRQQAESAKLNSSVTQFLSQFTYSEIANATCHFHHSCRIKEGSIYRGILHRTEVAIKLVKDPSEYRLEVEALSRLRHPNIVTMIGVCTEAMAIVHEYCPNSSLEDRLNCKDSAAPLTWQARIRIAFELCSVLIFLHSSKPQSFVHGALHPSNILLDANFSIKLSHFGYCRTVTGGGNSPLKSYVDGLGNVLMKMIIQRTANEESSQSHGIINNVSSCTYMDPESVLTGEVSTQLDVYAFGKIILKLLIGNEAWRVSSKVEHALHDGTFSNLLDTSAGDWPWPDSQAQQLAYLAVRCADMNRETRPDLKTDVLELLRTMKNSWQGSFKSSPLVHDEESYNKPPSYSICPISQDVMQNPTVAADGFTYEAEAIQRWINSGHDTSPMTNLTLAHTNLVPNLALRSTIQEWLHNH